MVVKALNDTAGLHGIILTLLIFGTYLQINKDLHLSPDILRKRGRPKKGQRTTDLAIKLRLDNVITTLGAPYKESDEYLSQAVREIQTGNLRVRRLGEGGPSYLGTYYPEDKPEALDDRLTHTIIARLPKELENKYPKDTLLYITKPLYSLAESGLY
ncbi:hypothetical protein CT0861_05452 [Colletotrichum tofieldiae]|uniref:Uncharacterized protein n=1 Tax=Colletotrichum tofieldiae TaxID=708197 RepID=A0A166TGD0_9PEZI|nr:hypothetical protein CT0861_05452 [Colletotrichum tofieldiae]